MIFRSGDLLAEFERLTRGLDLGDDFEKAVGNISTAFSTGSGVDAVRTSEAFTLYLDLPGVDPGVVELTVDGRNVTVSATRDFEIGDGELVHAGRRHGAFHRTFKLADDLDPELLTARSEHGVLIISVPVSESAQPRRIAIDVADND